MKKNFDFEHWKADLWLRNSLRNAKEDNYSDRAKKIAKGIEKVSIRKIYDQAIYIDKELLPRIEKSRGEGSEDFKFFRSVFTTMLWAVCLADRAEWYETKIGQVSMQLEFYKQHAEKLERMLNKYATLEDLFLSDGLDVMAQGVAQHVRNLLETKTT